METLGFNSPSLNPKNVLPQWQQKIANAENNSDQALDPLIFCTKCNFLQVLDLHIFRQLARLLMPVPLPFSPYLYNLNLFAKWQWELRQKNLKNILSHSIMDKILLVGLYPSDRNQGGNLVWKWSLVPTKATTLLYFL